MAISPHAYIYIYIYIYTFIHIAIWNFGEKYSDGRINTYTRNGSIATEWEQKIEHPHSSQCELNIDLKCEVKRGQKMTHTRIYAVNSMRHNVQNI